MNVGRRLCGCCGQELMPEARFCGNCGKPVPEKADQACAPGAHARTGRRSVLLWPAVVVLAVLLAGGGFTAALALSSGSLAYPAREA